MVDKAQVVAQSPSSAATKGLERCQNLIADTKDDSAMNPVKTISGILALAVATPPGLALAGSGW